MLIFSPRLWFSAALLGFAAPAITAPKIGVLLKGRTAFWTAAEKGALKAGGKLGAEIVVKAPLGEGDVSVQIQMLNALVADGVAAIVIAPCSREALSAPLAAVEAKGIKVVVIDSPLNDSAHRPFVAADNLAVGQAAGQLLAKWIKETDDVCILRHSQSSGAAKEREKGAYDTLRSTFPKLPLHAEIFASAQEGAEAQKVRFMLTTYPQIKAVFVSSTVATMAVLHVLAEEKRNGEIKVVGCGFNLNPEVATAIEAGRLHGWIAQFPQEMSALGVAAAIDLLAGKKPPAFIPVPYLIVTQENLKTPEAQALLAL